MNILPKKRWHVRTRENIARVRKDEAAAAEEEREKERRIKLAEKEAKINFLRTQSRLKSGIPEIKSVPESVKPTSTGHINFFENLEEVKAATSEKNVDHEREIKEEKEKYEKQIGYLTYLGQDTNESSGKVSWYNKPRNELETDYLPKNGEKDAKIKSMMDPINRFLPYLSKKPIAPESSKVKVEEKIIQNTAKHELKKSKKKKKKHSKCDSAERELVERKEKQIKLKLLREKRLKRENEEKQKIDKVLAKLRGDKSPPKVVETVRITQKYNSQFNPHLARQNHVS